MQKAPAMTTCPKCSYTRKPTDTAHDYECPSCGIIYAKFDAKADLENRLRLAMKTGNWSNVPPEHIPEAVRVRLQAQETLLRQQAAEQQQQDGIQRRKLARQTLPLTTTPTIPNREISGVLDVVSAECAYGINVLGDLLAGLTDVVGGRSGSTEKVLRDARHTVMAELRGVAFDLGADAVVGVNLAYSEFSGGGKSMLFVVATGTAVKLA
jgi:uncharacterized protein YbjQ (UPF0145 family)